MMSIEIIVDATMPIGPSFCSEWSVSVAGTECWFLCISGSRDQGASDDMLYVFLFRYYCLTYIYHFFTVSRSQ